MSTENGKIRIVSVVAENFHRLRVAEVRYVPEKGLIRVTGPNRAGKTSLLRSIAATLGGASFSDEDTIHDGEESGFSRIELSNGFTVERRYTEANPKGYLAVTSADGGKYGQSKLNEWLTDLSFDPMAFMSLKPDQQREVLLSLGTDPGLPERLKELDERRQKVYEQRTPVIVRKRELGKIEEPEGEKPEKVDVSEQMARLRELQAQERARGDKQRELRELEVAREETKGDIARVQSEIEELERKLAAAREKENRLRQDAQSIEADIGVAKMDLAEMEDPSDEIEKVQERIERAEEVNESRQPWERYEQAQAELEEVQERYEELTAAIDDIDAEKDRALAEANIPVPGLSFTPEGEPLIHGHPFHSASGREKIEVAVAVAMAKDPELPICLVDEANDLDSSGLEALDELAKEHGFQVWACRIDEDNPGEVVVEDGEARDREAVEA